MANVSLIRSVATGTIAAGVAVLCWFNRLPRQEQDEAEQVARGYSTWLIDKARNRLGNEDSQESKSLPRK